MSDLGWSQYIRELALADAADQAAADEEALDAIAALLDEREWDVGDLETIADLVRATGRTIREPNED